MVFETYALYPHISGLENLASPLNALRMNKEEIKFKILDVLQEKIDNKVLCVYSSDFLMIKLKLIDNELKKIGYSLYIINNNIENITPAIVKHILYISSSYSLFNFIIYLLKLLYLS